MIQEFMELEFDQDTMIVANFFKIIKKGQTIRLSIVVPKQSRELYEEQYGELNESN